MTDAEFNRILTCADPKPTHCQCDACRGGTTHASDCAVHNMPASQNKPCDCGVGERCANSHAETGTAHASRARTILAIDPGTTESGWCLYHTERGVMGSGVKPNDLMLDEIRYQPFDHLAIEMIASYGMAVGREVFETCVWIGRMIETFQYPRAVRLVYRRDVKLHLCGSPRAKDANIRQALLDLIGPQGTKKQPGPTYGVKSHAWAALGVAVTAAHQMREAA